MSSDNGDCRVVVSGIRGLSEDDIVLFLESPSYCPNGGPVKSFVQLSEDEAVIIFEDSKVANRIEQQLTLENGTELSVEPYVEYQKRKRSQTALNTRQVSPENDNCSGNQGSRDNSNSLEPRRSGNNESRSHKGSSRSAENLAQRSGKSNFSFNETQFRPRPIFGVSQKIVQETLSKRDSSWNEISASKDTRSSSSRSSSRRGSDDSIRELSKSHDDRADSADGKHDVIRDSSGNCYTERSQVSSVNHGTSTGYKHSERDTPGSKGGYRNQTDGYNSHSDKFEGKNPPSNPRKSHDNSERPSQGSTCRPATPSHESTNRCNESHTAGSEHAKRSKGEKPPVPQKPNQNKRVEKLQFPCEKLKLIKLIWDLNSALSSSCKCDVKFDEQTNSVILEGADGATTDTRIILHEMIIASEEHKLEVTPQVQTLLATDKFKNWLTAYFLELGIPAYVYSKDAAAANLIAMNKDTLSLADEIITQLVSTQNISFKDCHISFLQSPTWSQKVQAIETSNLISAHVDFSKNKIELTGSKSDVDVCATDIRELLQRNHTETRTIGHKIGVIRLLKKQESSINKNIQDVVSSSSIRIEFDSCKGIVRVTGLLNEVQIAEDIIYSYMRNICYGTHEISTPGLTEEMFQVKYGKQWDMIELLENRHNCVIEVRGGNQCSSQQEGSQTETLSTNIEVVLGNIVQFKADVLVSTVADEGLEMGGVILKQFLKAGAPNLQQELQRLGIPQIFGNDVVATDAYGELKAKFIFHAAIRKYQNEDSIEKLQTLIKKCLEMAAQRKASTIAFPALGGGRLAFNSKDVVECFIRASHTAQTSIKIFIVAVDDHIHKDFKSHLSNILSETSECGLTNEMFRVRLRNQEDTIALAKNRHKCREGNQRKPEGSRSKISSKEIEVTLGNIVQFKADVLVSTVADEGLELGGVVLKQFLEAGAPNLQQELQKLGIPRNFGRDVVVTDACGKLNAKFILLAAIRKHQNPDSIKKLHNMIKKCLEMAAQRKASTIAFPALGGGRLAFNSKDVVECFVRAKQTTRSNIKVFIVAVDEKTHKEFKSHLSIALSDAVENETKDDAQRRGGIGGRFKDFASEDKGRKNAGGHCPLTPVRNLVVFHINTTIETDIRLVKEGLIERLKEMVNEFFIKDDFIGTLDDNSVAFLRDLQTPDVAIHIDRRNGVITMKGDCLKVLEIKGLIIATIVGMRDMVRYPDYWTNFRFTDDSASKVGVKQTRINPNTLWYAEITHLVMTSWDQSKVGFGRDASGLGQHAIKIRNVYCIENPGLLEKYMAKRKQLSKEASLHKFSPVNGLRGEQEIATMNLGLRHLYGTLNGDVNEVFLLHGTKKETVDLINSDGLDSRICGDETLFGFGSYFAESSTKADQYADAKDNRVALGQPLYMFVCRVLLGQPYVCDDPDKVKDYKRPPCMQQSCYKDKCPHTSPGRFDSVIGTHRPNPQQNGRLFFREFVVFHPEQSYPDFLVEYERVNCP